MKKSKRSSGAADPARSLGLKASRVGRPVKRSTAGGPKSEQKRAAEARERAGQAHVARERSRFLGGAAIDPRRIDGTERVSDLIEGTFLAYNAARLREACQLFTDKMLEKDVTIGLTMTGALTPAGLGMAAVIPLIEAGFVDWIISTGANLYHDLHFGLDMKLHSGSPFLDDVVLHREGVIRIYDVLFPAHFDTRGEVLLFSGAQFHRTLPQARGRTRFSLDFRVVDLDDHARGRGAPNANQLPTNLIMMKGLDVLGCPMAITTSTLATVVSVSATMKAVYITAQHRPENQITRSPARMSRNSARPRSGSSRSSRVRALNRLRQKVTSKLRAASRWRVTTPAMLHSSVTSTISATARPWFMNGRSPTGDPRFVCSSSIRRACTRV